MKLQFLFRQLSIAKDRVLNVEIGDFMDIICPQSGLVDAKSFPRQPMIFDLYNVSRTYFKACRQPGKIVVRLV